jgi:hypothetical protein
VWQAQVANLEEKAELGSNSVSAELDGLDRDV